MFLTFHVWLRLLNQYDDDRVGRFLPEGGKTVFFRSKNRTGKNSFRRHWQKPVQNCHQSKLLHVFSMYLF